MRFFSKKKEEEMNNCQFSEMMEGAMSIQGKAMVNQTELNIAYQAFAMFKWHDMINYDKAISDAAKVVVDLEKEIEKRKRKDED